MQNLKLFRYLQPYFYSGLFDDPVLIINTRPTGRCIMIDCGQIHHLAKRVIRSIDAIFISHAHMDHFMGFDHVLRNVHVAPRDLEVYGPPGIALRVEHKLAGYDWNLKENTWCDIRVHEIHPHRLEIYEFAGKQGFTGHHCKTFLRHDPTIYRTPYLKVETAICDHKIPTLIFRITERESFMIDRQRMALARLQPGPWLRELKKRFYLTDWGTSPIEVVRVKANGLPAHERVENIEGLYRAICRSEPPGSIGYISDLGYNKANCITIKNLLFKTNLLFSECTFLSKEKHKARTSSHLCTSDLNHLVAMLKPEYLVPMHLSKSYMNATGGLYRELELPPGTTVLQLPDYMTPRPLLPNELTGPLPGQKG